MIVTIALLATAFASELHGKIAPNKQLMSPYPKSEWYQRQGRRQESQSTRRPGDPEIRIHGRRSKRESNAENTMHKCRGRDGRACILGVVVDKIIDQRDEEERIAHSEWNSSKRWSNPVHARTCRPTRPEEGDGDERASYHGQWQPVSAVVFGPRSVTLHRSAVGFLKGNLDRYREEDANADCYLRSDLGNLAKTDSSLLAMKASPFSPSLKPYVSGQGLAWESSQELDFIGGSDLPTKTVL